MKCVDHRRPYEILYARRQPHASYHCQTEGRPIFQYTVLLPAQVHVFYQDCVADIALSPTQGGAPAILLLVAVGN